MVWNTSVPAGSDQIRNGDDAIREFKQDMQDALQAEGAFPVDVNAPKFYYRGSKGAETSRPTRGGLFFNETKSVLERDNGSSWEPVGTLIPSGTYMIFKQSSAPTGWTKVSNSDWYNSFIRIWNESSSFVSGQGGTFGYISPDYTDWAGQHDHDTVPHSHQVGGPTTYTGGLSESATETSPNYRLRDDGAGWVNRTTNGYHIVVQGGSNDEGEHDHIINLISDETTVDLAPNGNHRHYMVRSSHDETVHRFTDVIVAQKD